MPAKPILDGVELQQVEWIEGDQSQILKQHRIPALEGDFLQPLGRRAGRIRLRGVLTGTNAGKSLETLRTKFRAAMPVPFVADIATATKIARVLIQEMQIRELAGKPERFEYALTLVEYIGPSGAKATAPSPESVPLPSVNAGKLAVEGGHEGQSRLDGKTVTVSVEGKREQGWPYSRSLSNRSVLTWSDDSFPPGRYSVSAVAPDPPMSGSAEVVVRAGQTSRVTVRLRSGASIARAFVVHFSFDKAFIEPSMRPVLEQVAEYARSHPGERLAIVGHTDLTGSAAHNQLLSERRAHSVFEYLTQGHRDFAQMEWVNLRRTDSWGRREYESMLLDLGYFPCNPDADTQFTKGAVQAFQADHGLTANGVVEEETWAVLIGTYMRRSLLAVPPTQILSAANIDEEQGPFWQGRGGEEPVRVNTLDALRPKPADGVDLCEGRRPRSNEWLVQPAETRTIMVRGSISLDNGTPLGHAKYVLTAPDGEYMDGQSGLEARSRATRCWAERRRTAHFCTERSLKGTGVYTLEIEGPFIARLRGERPEIARGPYLWKRLDGTSNFDVLVGMRPKGISTSGL